MSGSRQTFNLVIAILGATLVLSVGGVIALGVIGNPPDDVLKQLAVGCLAALAGLLAKTPDGDGPQKIVGVAGGEPVAVERAKP